MSLNIGQFIISGCHDEEIKDFLKKAVANYFDELSLYIDENQDSGIIHYATERTMASLFVSGNLRRDPKMTGVQEYGILCTKNGEEVKGRPDIFIKYGATAIWIECKFQKNIKKLEADHWDISGWLEWDRENVFSQVETYYNSEADGLNSVYEKRYLITLCFKVIKENQEEHERNVERELLAKANGDYDRVWYYQVAFFEGEENCRFGIEVYGTCFSPTALVDVSNNNSLKNNRNQ